MTNGHHQKTKTKKNNLFWTLATLIPVKCQKKYFDPSHSFLNTTYMWASQSTANILWTNTKIAQVGYKYKAYKLRISTFILADYISHNLQIDCGLTSLLIQLILFLPLMTRWSPTDEECCHHSTTPNDPEQTIKTLV